MNPNTEQMKDLVRDLKIHDIRAELVSLHAQDSLQSVLAFCMDWSIICIAMYIASYGWLYSLLAIILIGSRQRALSNLVHDASHGNLFQSKSINDFLTNIFAAFPMLDTVSSYRNSHLFHHRYLGNQQLDPDSKSHLRYGYDDQNPPTQTTSRIYFNLLFNQAAWKDSAVGTFLTLARKHQAMIIAWWIALTIALIPIVGVNQSVFILCLWFTARLTSYHAIRIFAEFLDHSGLPTTTQIEFTRNLPHNGILPFLFHPHEDTFHMAHHIFMGIPHFKLRKAHAVLMNAKNYREAHHCDSYFFGSHSALSCWVGQNCQIEYTAVLNTHTGEK